MQFFFLILNQQEIREDEMIDVRVSVTTIWTLIGFNLDKGKDQL